MRALAKEDRASVTRCSRRARKRMNAQPEHRSDEAASSGTDFVALTRSPGFWVIIRSAALFGVVLAFAALAFLALVNGGTKLWFTLPNDPGWLDGKLWWVAVTAGAGVLVGVLRRLLRLPAELPGTIAEIKEQRIEPAMVPGAVAVSLVSLAGGASLGPEDALGKLGGGLGTWVSDRQKLSEDTQRTNTLSGMSGAYGGLLASPILATILVLEVAPLKGRRYADVLFACLLSSSIAFALYYAIAGSTFVGIYAVPSYTYEDWHLLAAVPLGLAAAALALITVIVIGVMKKVTAPLAKWTILLPTIGGVMFGLVGVALPLTLFTGTDQLDTVIKDGATLGAGLLIAVVFAKMLVFALCEATGFIGGPFLVMLFIGGTAGTAANLLIPGLPEGLAFTAMFAALPGALVAVPFSLILLAALTTQVGTLQIAPVAIAVITAYLAVSGTGTLTALASRASKPAGSSDGAAQSRAAT
jgi:chloride channel protein, CIC family